MAISAISCEHANENPKPCPCKLDCYCRIQGNCVSREDFLKRVDEEVESLYTNELNHPSTNEINHPSHYNRGGIECISVIEAWELNFNLGNSLKYICRAGFKSSSTKISDLQKAKWYIERELSLLEKSNWRK